MSNKIVPFSLKDAPSLIEKLFPVQKLSAESYKEQMANTGKTLTALGSYWKGRKPLILNRACILGALLPATSDSATDLKIFEMLLGFDNESFVARWKRKWKPKEILARLKIDAIQDFFVVEPSGVLPESSPIDWSIEGYRDTRVQWREDVLDKDRLRLETQMLPSISYRELVSEAKRPEEVSESISNHIWFEVNKHLGTDANSLTGLVEQLGIMRFGHRPRVADTFSGSGQIPFEAARIGCDVFASDLNPVSCLLTWGAVNIVGGSEETRKQLQLDQRECLKKVRAKLDKLDVEKDVDGDRARAYLYCLETRCPQSGWMVPLLPSFVVNKDGNVIVSLVPDSANRRYGIEIRSGVTSDKMKEALEGTLQNEGRGKDSYLVHSVDGKQYRTKISTIRGDFRSSDGETGNGLRMWGKSNFTPLESDIFQDRLYAVQWQRKSKTGKRIYYEFRSTTERDMENERRIVEFVGKNLSNWQASGWIPDSKIEPGDKTDEPIRTRGWTYWHHLFNPRQILLNALFNQYSSTALKLACINLYQQNAKLSRWDSSAGGRAGIKQVFDNQALNTLYNYGARGFVYSERVITRETKWVPLDRSLELGVVAASASDIVGSHDIYVTDPPYGDAVKYEEILEFFIAWLRKNPPAEFADWVWDSRRSMAIKGEDEDFRRGMVAAYKRMTECMPDNGIQVIMFTHQSGSIWADMANIVWASGLQVTAAWYVVTETESALRDGNNVKGTVLLVCRKRLGKHKTTRDELAWEIAEEVQSQVESLTGLNQQAKGLYRDENVFEDADIQMAGYAAALRVLTRYSTIDGRDMASESIRPRVKNEVTFVDDLIGYAVATANQCLVPQGIAKSHWDKLSGAERFYLKMIDMEARGFKTLDNYQNFAKAFKVRDFQAFMASRRANSARLKSAVEFARTDMGEASELYKSVLRAVLYAIMELAGTVEPDDVLAHLTMNVPNWFGDMNQREMAKEFADYLAKRLEELRPEEAASARVLRDLIRNQRIG